jgi:hypothetical protein
VAAPQQAKSDAALRTLALVSTTHWVSHFHMIVLPMLFPFLKAQLGVGYIELGFALTVFAVVSGLTQAPMGYLSCRSYRRPQDPVDRTHCRRRRTDDAWSASELSGMLTPGGMTISRP